MGGAPGAARERALRHRVRRADDVRRDRARDGQALRRAAGVIGPEDLISADELARRLGVKPKTLANERSAAKGPAYYKLHGRIYYSMSDVDAWLATRRVVPDAGRA